MNLILPAKLWQEYRNRPCEQLVGRVIDEAREYFATTNSRERLEELGDMLVNSQRIVLSLSPAQVEYIERTASIKAHLRCEYPKTKSKERERELFDRIANKLGL